jgi:hypothetical protein
LRVSVPILLIFLSVLGGILVEVVSGSLLLAIAMMGLYSLFNIEHGLKSRIDSALDKRISELPLFEKTDLQLKQSIERDVNKWRTRTGYIFLLSAFLFVSYYLTNNRIPDIPYTQAVTTDDWLYYGAWFFVAIGFVQSFPLAKFMDTPSSDIPFRFDRLSGLVLRALMTIGGLSAIIGFLNIDILQLTAYYQLVQTSAILSLGVYGYIISLVSGVVGGIVLIIGFLPTPPKVEPRMMQGATLLLLLPILYNITLSALSALGVSLP